MKHYLFKFKGRLAVAVLLITLAGMLNVGTAFVFKGITEAITGETNQGFWEASLIAITFILVSAFINFASEWSKSAYLRRSIIHLKNDVFERIMGKSITDFNSANSAKYLSVINNDVKMLEDDYFRTLFMLLGQVVAFTSGLVSMLLLSYQIASILVFMAVLSILIPRIFATKLTSARSRFAESLEHFTIKVNDLFSGFQVIKSFKIEHKIKQEYSAANEGAEHHKFRFNLLSAGVGAVSEVFGGLMFISTFLIGGFLTLKGHITFGVLIACVQLTNSVVNPIYSSVQYLSKIKSLQSISRKIIHILEPSHDRVRFTPKDKLEQQLALNNVSFGYDDSRQVLHNINLTIKKNQKIAFVGASGSGKSTLLKLLLKEYENYEGSITVDGIPLKMISGEDVYHFSSILHQNTFLFDSTVRENIRLYGPYSDEEVSLAALLAGLTPLLEKLPYGIDSLVGENGSLLSGGERQRVAVARMLLRKTPLILLDEATSALDNETAYAIEETILEMEETTAVIVTHRLNKSLLERYDRIYVLQEGRIVEQGVFAELIELKGYFYSLYSIENIIYESAIPAVVAGNG